MSELVELVELESCFAGCSVGVKRQMCVGVCLQYHKVLFILLFSGIMLVLAHAPLRSGIHLGSATKRNHIFPAFGAKCSCVMGNETQK